MSNMMIEELYDALKEAGGSKEKSRAAAHGLTNYESRFSDTKNDLNLLIWMAGGIWGLRSQSFFACFPGGRSSFISHSWLMTSPGKRKTSGEFYVVRNPAAS